jgi:hypothetical protein
MELAPAGTLPTPRNFLVAWTAMTVTRRWWLAATGVLLAIIAAGIVLATGVILLPVHTSGSTAVPLTVISRSGPGSPIVGGSLKILAATSVDDLQALAMTGTVYGPNQSNCRAIRCWTSVTIGRPSLLIALSGPTPCRKSVLSADLDPGAHLTIHEVVGGLTCPIGDQAAPAPTYWLLAVPLDGLPSTVLTVAVDYPPAPGGPASGQPLKLAGGSTTVDLRLPRPNRANRVTSPSELQGAVQSAGHDAESRRTGNRVRLIDLALRRWPRADVGCGSGANDSDLTWGSLIVFRVDTLTSVVAYEYHALADRSVFCRELTP